ncbi:MAG TPA: hypothetical protein DEQ02_08705 [Ruminococcaceae bacterium]|nr:hypothetical protein [Oscillospiraceae bacterium]
MSVFLRAHHLLCLSHFVGKGYSDGFTRHMAKVLARLKNGEELCLVSGCDDICSHCPHKSGGVCASGNPEAIDAEVFSRTKLSPGVRMTWNKAAGIIKPLCSDIQRICGKCEWRTLCEKNHKILDIFV